MNLLKGLSIGWLRNVSISFCTQDTLPTPRAIHSAYHLDVETALRLTMVLIFFYEPSILGASCFLN